jgi:hypothetical protein
MWLALGLVGFGLIAEAWSFNAWKHPTFLMVLFLLVWA